MRPDHSHSPHQLLGVILLMFTICASPEASAQCVGTELVLHTFTSFANAELSWELASENGTMLTSYDWQGNAVNTYDTLCFTEPCPYMITHSFTGDGWGFGALVEVIAEGEVIQTIDFNAGELGYFPLDTLAEDCAFELPGCMDPVAINATMGANAEDGSCDYIYDFDWNGTTRQYLTHVPSDLPENAPLVVVLHGMSGTMEGMRQETTFHHLADEHGFAVCWPQGSLWNWDGSILPYWNANLFLTPADDIGFLTALAESLQSEHGLSTECTFVAGASNGGMMAYTLISERPDVWKGMATAGGVMSAHEQTNGTVGPPRPVLHIHGTADNAMPYYAYPGGGGPWTGGWGVMEMMEFWAEEHGHTTLDSIPLPDEFPGDNLTEDVFEWTGGLGRLVHHRVNGGVHEWWGALATPNEVATSEIVWDFFADLCANPMSIEATPFGQASLANAPVYPNPVSAGASVQWPCARGALYEASGRWVGTTTGHAPEAPGLYIIQCTNGQTTRLLVR